jgi:hypothetical protein
MVAQTIRFINGGHFLAFNQCHTQSNTPTNLISNTMNRRRIVRARAQGEEQQGGSSSSNPPRQPPPSQSPSLGAADEWWASLNKRSVRGPALPAVDPEPKTSAEWNERRMGVKGYREFETIKRDERQRGAFHVFVFLM